MNAAQNAQFADDGHSAASIDSVLQAATRALRRPNQRRCTVYDAIVVGARCAGSPTAMLLARKGYRVLLVDKDTFPSDTFRNHFIHNSGAAQLKRWGVLKAIQASNCPPITKWTFDIGPFALHGTPPPAGDLVACYAPRRTVLDKILVDA